MYLGGHVYPLLSWMHCSTLLDLSFSLCYLLQVYAGRLAAASPAAGSHKRHDQEQSKLIADAFA